MSHIFGNETAQQALEDNQALIEDLLRELPMFDAVAEDQVWGDLQGLLIQLAEAYSEGADVLTQHFEEDELEEDSFDDLIEDIMSEFRPKISEALLQSPNISISVNIHPTLH